MYSHSPFLPGIVLYALLALSSSPLLAQSAPADTFTQLDIIEAMARYRSDWFVDIHDAPELCEDFNELLVFMSTGLFTNIEYEDEDEDDKTSQKKINAQLRAGVDSVLSRRVGLNLHDKAAKHFKRCLWDLLYNWSPHDRYARFVKRYPEYATGIDTAATFGCLRSIMRSIGIARDGIVKLEPPYKLTLDSTTLDEELVMFRMQPGMTVADVGSGEGTIAHLIAYLGLNVHATERYTMIDNLRALHRYMPTDVAELFTPVHATNKDLKLKPTFYDLIIVRNTLHHLKKREEALLQIREALLPTGRLIVVEHYSDLHPLGQGACEKIESFSDQRAQLEATGFYLTREVNVSEISLLTEWQIAQETN